MRKIRLTSDINNLRIDAWLKEQLPEYSRTYIKTLINDCLVLVNKKEIKSNYKLKFNDEILINIPDAKILDAQPEQIDIPILYEDNDILVVNKPKGMVVHPSFGNVSGTLVNALLNHCKDNLSNINGIIRPGIVHRIDKDTSGVLVVAKNNESHEKLCNLLKHHDIKRVYVALTERVITKDTGKIDAPIGRHPIDRKKMAVNLKNGRNAVTYFKVLERFDDITYIEVTLETGRTHQIRVHMSQIGYPILGDTIYGKNNSKYITHGQALHAKVLGFVHPIIGKYVEFEAELPGYFQEIIVLKKLIKIL